MLKIRIKVGDVEIEYQEEYKLVEQPRLQAEAHTYNKIGRKPMYEIISELADKANEIHTNMYETL
jgi:Ni,Fe-hydrogenase I small subunit